MRTSRSISRVVNRVNRKDEINWSDWEPKRVGEVLDFFKRKKLCKTVSDIRKQYNIFLVAYCNIDDNILKILNAMMDKTPGLSEFMSTHSTFDADANSKGDWLQRFMIEKLMPTDEEVYKFFHPEPVPQYLLDKFKLFDPVQVIFEMDPIRIEYGMWRRGGNKRILDPINIIYTDFDDIDFVKPEDVKREISQYKDIESDPVEVEHDDWLVEDDLPF